MPTSPSTHTIADSWTLPPLRGEERLLAHAQVQRLTTVPVGQEATKEQDGALLHVVLRDPSLFVEAIPEMNPMAPNGGEGWSAHRNWWGTWACKVAANGFVGSVTALLQAGIHPDDAGAFVRRPIWLENWNSRPERLAILLRYGANPDLPAQLEAAGGFRASPNASVLRVCLRRVNGATLSVWRESKSQEPDETLAAKNEPRLRDIRTHVECVRLLLRSNARRLDPVNFDVFYDDGDVAEPANSMWTAVGSIVEHMDQLEGHQVERALLEELLGELVDAGASVDRPSGVDQEPPVTTAVRNRDLAALWILLSKGADASDASIVREESAASSGRHIPKVRPLLETALKVGGHEFRAQVTEMLMQQSIQRAPLPKSAPAARRNARASV